MPRLVKDENSSCAKDGRGECCRTASPGMFPLRSSSPAVPGASGRFQGIKGFRGISSPPQAGSGIPRSLDPFHLQQPGPLVGGPNASAARREVAPADVAKQHLHVGQAVQRLVCQLLRHLYAPETSRRRNQPFPSERRRRARCRESSMSEDFKAYLKTSQKPEAVSSWLIGRTSTM